MGKKKSTKKQAASKGGNARAKKLSKSERSEIARKAAKKRWDVPSAVHEGSLHIGDVDIPCYVLEDGTRLISHRGLQGGLTMAVSGGAIKTSEFFGKIASKLPAANDLAARLNEPIVFKPKAAGRSAFGYDASILADICYLMMDARKHIKQLTPMQARVADQCDVLIRGFGKVGIIALVDEATGYQNVRSRNALAEILEAFIKDEAGKWAKRFPDEFYKELFRLKNKPYPFPKNPPQYVGHWTNNVIYHRLAPGVLKDLREKNPVTKNGRRKRSHHQWFTEDVGHPKLQEHIQAVLALMRASDTWDDFEKMLNRALPKQPQTADEKAQKRIEFVE